MRSLTDAQTAALSSKNRSTHVQVRIFEPSLGAWFNLEDLDGYDWVHSVSYGSNEDNPTQVATVKLYRNMGDLSLAPLMDGSRINTWGAVADIGNQIVINVAVLGQDMEPNSTEWVEVHNGFIDEVSWADEFVTLKARDKGGLLIEKFIDTPDSVYGLEAGDPMEDVIQDILDDHASVATTLYSPNGTGGTPFNAGDSPGFNIIPYNQDQETVMSAIRRVAQLIGAEVGYKWHANTSAFQLVFQQPGRATSAQGEMTWNDANKPSNNETCVINATTFTAKTTPAGNDDFLIGADGIETAANFVQMFNTTGSERNNAWAHLSAISGPPKVIITWTPGAAGNSVTFTESLSWVTFDGGGTLGGTTAGTDANGTVSWTFDSSAYFSVNMLKISTKDVRNQIEVAFDSGNGDVKTVRVSDAASITKYGPRFMKITEASSSQIDTHDEALTLANAALADLSEPNIDHAITVPYFWPAEIGDNYTFKANGKHYDTDQTLALTSVRHDIANNTARTVLTARGKPSGGKKRWLSIEGRPGVAPVKNDKVSAIYRSPDTASHDRILPNGDFGSTQRGGANAIPEGWTPSEEWKSSYVTSIDSASGRNAIQLATDGTVTTTSITSDYFPVTAGAPYAVGLSFRESAGGDLNAAEARTRINWYDKNKELISSNNHDIMYDASFHSGYIGIRSGGAAAPAAAVFATVDVEVYAANISIDVDRVDLIRARPYIQASAGSGDTFAVGTTTITPSFVTQEAFEVSYGSGVFTINHEGVYAIQVSTTLNDTAAFTWALRLRTTDVQNFTTALTTRVNGYNDSATINSNHRGTITLNWVQALIGGDTIDTQVIIYTTGATPVNLDEWSVSIYAIDRVGA